MIVILGGKMADTQSYCNNSTLNLRHFQSKASLPEAMYVVKYQKSHGEVDAAIFELYTVHKEVTALQKVAGVSSILNVLYLT